MLTYIQACMYCLRYLLIIQIIFSFMENTIPHIESVEHGEYTPMVGISTNNIESSLDIQAQQARVEKRVSQLTTLIASADSDV